MIGTPYQMIESLPPAKKKQIFRRVMSDNPVHTARAQKSDSLNY